MPIGRKYHNYMKVKLLQQKSINTHVTNKEATFLYYMININ